MAQPKDNAHDEARAEDPTTEFPWDGTIEDGRQSAPIGESGTLSRYELVVGRYLVLRLLGTGGMGEVYEVEDLELHDHLALKIIRPEIARHAEAITRFKQEIQLLRKITHPNVCRIFDVGYHPGVLNGPQENIFFTMELLRGHTLAKQIREFGPLTIAQALPLVEGIAAGLAAVHKAGVVHRDLKNANVVLVPTAEEIRPVIADFGLALATTGESFPAGSESVVGTPEYMAPEQLANGDVTSASDIYALGVVIYNIVTGELPFTGDSRRSATLKRLELPPVPPHQHVPDLDPRWEKVILRCLEITPEKRFRKATDVSSALRVKGLSATPGDGIFESMTSTTKRGRVGRWKAAIKGLVAMSILALLGLLVFSMLKPMNRDQETERHLAVLPFTVINKDPETQAFADGLAETVAANIAQLPSAHSLRIIPITELRAQHVNTAERARQEFGADLVVTGSLQTSGSLVRITVVVIDAIKRRQLGGSTGDFARADSFALQDRVAADVLTMLKIRPTTEEQGRLLSHGTVYAQAYDEYLKALGYLQDYEKPESVENAVEMLNNALHLDPNYGSAYAALGEAYWYKYESSHNTSWVQKARDSCERSVKLQPGLAGAHACLGNVYKGTGEPEQAVEEFNLAMELDPSDAGIYRGLAGAYEAQRRTEEAEKAYKQAIRLMPRYWSGYSRLGAFYYVQARYQDAVTMFQKVIELAPDNQRGYSNLGGIYVAQGRYGDAVPVLRRAAIIHPDGDAYTNLAIAYFQLRQFAEAERYYELGVRLNEHDYVLWGNLASAQYRIPDTKATAMASYRQAITLALRDLEVNPRKADLLCNLADYYSMLGDKPKAMMYLRRALALAPNDPWLKLHAGEIHNQLGETDLAFKYLKQAVARGYSRTLLQDTPVLDNLRSDARFEELLTQKINH